MSQPTKSGPERATAETQAPGWLRVALNFPAPVWEQERDARLDRFIAACLARAEETGCTAERQLAAGVHSVFAEWHDKRELSLRAGNDVFAAQISALGWALRCVAHSAWSTAPGWEPGFHPHAMGPNTSRQVPA